MSHAHDHAGCPGARVLEFTETEDGGHEEGTRSSQLRQWPVQLHLVPPTAPYFHKSDVLLAADCVAFAVGDFHKDYLSGKSLAIACPKLDQGLEVYREKITALVDEAEINTLTVMTMEVPCCSGLLELAKAAVGLAKRNVPVKSLVVSLQGQILTEVWC